MNTTNTMWLQLFALTAEGMNATVASGSTGAGPVNGDLSVEMKEFYKTALIRLAGPEMIHGQFAQKKPIPAGNGKVIEFRRYASFPKALKPLTEGVPPTSNKLQASAIKASVEQYGAVTQVSDILELAAVDDNIAEATEMGSRQAGLTKDTLTRNVLHTGTRVFYCPSVSDSDTEITSRKNLKLDSKLTIDVVMQVVALLRASNAPTINGKYICIAHPYTLYELMRDPEWINVHSYSNAENIYEGEVGEIAGVRFVQTSEAKIYSNIGNPEGYTPNDSNDVKHDDSCPVVDGVNLGVFGSIFLGANAYGETDIEGRGIEYVFKGKEYGGPLEQWSTVGWKMLHCAEILIDDYIVRVESCSPKFSKELAAN